MLRTKVEKDYSVRHGVGNHSLAAVYGTNCADEVRQQHVLEQITTGAGLECPPNVGVALVGSEGEDARLGEFRCDSLDGRHPVHHRHSQVHESDIGTVLPVQGGRPLSILRLRHQLQVRLLHQHCGKAGPDDGVIVGHENPDPSTSIV